MPLGVALVGLVLPGLLVGGTGRILTVTPFLLPLVSLPSIGRGIAVPGGALVPLVATAVWSVVFVAVALWRFHRLEF